MIWSQNEVNLLKNNFLRTPDKELAKIIGKSQNALKIKAGRLGIRKESSIIRENLVLNETEKQVVLGGLLGDLHCRIGGKSRFPRLQGAHCLKQKDYALWKVNLLQNLRFKTRLTKINALWYESKSFKALEEYYQLFYSTGHKRVNNSILSQLNDFGLLIWYLDDGSFSKRDHNITLYTNGFNLEEQELMVSWFNSKYVITPKISPIKSLDYPNKIWYCLWFNVCESKKLIEIFKHFEIPDCMKYKLGNYPLNSYSTNINEKSELKLMAGEVG